MDIERQVARNLHRALQAFRDLATEMIGGVDIDPVMRFLGHSSVTTTQRYSHLAPESMAGVVDVLQGSHS